MTEAREIEDYTLCVKGEEEHTVRAKEKSLEKWHLIGEISARAEISPSKWSEQRFQIVPELLFDRVFRSLF